MDIGAPEFFLIAGSWIREWARAVGGVVNVPYYSDVSWNAYVAGRAPFMAVALAMTIFGVFVLPLSFCVVRCLKHYVSARRPNSCARLSLSIAVALLVAQILVGAVFLFVAMGAMASSFSNNAVEPIEVMLAGVESNATFVRDVAKEYGQTELLDEVNKFYDAFMHNGLGSEIQSLTDLSTSVLRGFRLALYAFGGFCLLVLLVFGLLVRVKCGRFTLAVLMVATFIIFGGLAIGATSSGLVLDDFEPHMTLKEVSNVCPTEQDVSSVVKKLNEFLAQEEEALKQPGLSEDEKQRLQKAISDTTQTLAIVNSFVGCQGLMPTLAPAREELFDTLATLAFFMAFVSHLLLASFYEVYAVTILHSIFWGSKHHHAHYQRLVSNADPENHPLIN